MDSIEAPTSTENENLWLEERKKRITGSDVAQILSFIVNGEKYYYDKLIYTFTRDKMNPRDISQWTKQLFKEGRLVEESIFHKLINKYGKENVYKNKIFYCGVFMATTDILVSADKGKQIIYEVKATTSEKKHEELKAGTHYASWQSCCQLYCAPPSVDKVVIIGVPIREISSYLSPVRFEITRDCYHYKAFIKNIETMQEVFNAYLEGREYFSKSTDIDTEAQSAIQTCCMQYIAIEEKIKALQQEKDMLSSTIKEYSLANTVEEIQACDNTKITLVKSFRSSPKDEFKKIIKSIEASYKNLASDEIKKVCGDDAYHKNESVSIRIKHV